MFSAACIRKLFFAAVAVLVTSAGACKQATQSNRSDASLNAKLGDLNSEASASDPSKPLETVTTDIPAPTSEPAADLSGKPIVEVAPVKFTDFVLGGNGPGSCGLPADSSNACRAGRSSLSCPAGYKPVSAIGDCYVTPGFGPQCFGNRPLCARTDEGVRPVVNIHFFDGSVCPAGWEPATVPSQPQGHRYGIVTGPNTDPAAYREAVLCRQTKEPAALVASDKLLKNVGILGIDVHGAAPACPGGHLDAGGLPDCTNGRQNPNYQWCVGMIRVCKALDVQR
jgi:hypothetical protein